MAITLNGTTGITTPDVDSTDLTATGNFTSRGIDDNATSTAMTLDSSGNLLVGKTSTSSTTAGGNIFGGLGSFVRDGNTPLSLNRRTNQGEIVSFAAQDTVVGNIGVSGGNNLYISGQASNHSGITFGTDVLIPTRQGAMTDNITDVGSAGNRFKDLYLSGGVYLGGTGAANALDDYEEGTFTPTFTPDISGSLPLQSNYDTMQYVKIGNWVTVSAFIRAATPSSPVGSYVSVGNFPFTVANLSDAAGRSAGSVSYFDDSAGNWSILPCYIVESQTQAYLNINSSNIGNNDGFYISLNYRTT